MLGPQGGRGALACPQGLLYCPNPSPIPLSPGTKARATVLALQVAASGASGSCTPLEQSQGGDSPETGGVKVSSHGGGRLLAL